LELRFDELFSLFCCGKGLSHPVDRRCCRVALPHGSGALEECGDLAQLLAEFLLSGHQNRSLAELGCCFLVAYKNSGYCMSIAEPKPLLNDRQADHGAGRKPSIQVCWI